jgi:hypothetical protein
MDRIFAGFAKVWKSMFGYQILIEATRPDSIESLMEKTFVDRRSGKDMTAAHDHGERNDAAHAGG